MGILILGSIIFEGFEIPEQIGLGGDHMLSVHKLLGGQRVIDKMGPDDRDIEWSGLMFGPLAQLRARALDSLRISGALVPLLIDTNMRQVVVRSFKWDYQRIYQIRYSITCIVASSTGLFGNGPGSLDDLVSGDLGVATGFAGSFSAAVFS